MWAELNKDGSTLLYRASARMVQLGLDDPLPRWLPHTAGKLEPPASWELN